MKKLLLIAVLIILATPLVAGALPHMGNVSISHNANLNLEDGQIVITNESRHATDRVIITEDGDLTINGNEIDTNNDEAKQLRKFYREAVKLENMADDIAADAERIARASKKFATAQVAAVLSSLRDDDDVDEDKMEAIEDAFEAEMEGIEKLADKIEKQADKVLDLGNDLNETIPELADLGWFLDE